MIPNPKKDIGLNVTEAVLKKLSELDITVYIDESTGLCRDDNVIGYSEFPSDAEILIVVGGDGSLIDASGYAIENDIPILGINLGRVGYLTEVEPENLDVLSKLASGEYFITEKMLLAVEVGNADERNLALAVNDVVISHENYLGISEFKIEDSIGNHINFRADGVILSTPQGSTAYSLSAGGPVVAHDVDGILLTPVCPHSFFNRSVIFNSSERIRVTDLGDDILNVSVDGRAFARLGRGDLCTVFKAEKKVKILSFSKNSMFTNLFKKMRILEDINR